MTTILPSLPDEGKANLRKLIAFLRELPLEKFFFGSVVEQGDLHGCGTVCCAVGWMPKVFPDRVKWVKTFGLWNVQLVDSMMEGGWWEGVASEVFGISEDMAADLFAPYRQHKAHKSLSCLGDDAKPGEVADMLEAYIELTETPA